MTDKKNTGSSLGAMLLMAMAALCLAVFSMLAMSSARAHKSVSDACLSETAGYYEACALADAELAGLRSSGSTGEYDFTYPISDMQDLRVSYRIYDGGRYDIYEWAPYPAGEWEEEEFIEVIH